MPSRAEPLDEMPSGASRTPRAPRFGAPVPPPPGLRPGLPPSAAGRTPGTVARGAQLANTAHSPGAVQPARPTQPSRAANPAGAAHAAGVPHATKPAQAAKPRKYVTATGLFAIFSIAALYAGWRFPTERYITPERGIGYALGIIGGSLMLVLLLYSARKHFRWLASLGPVASWFRFHMVLGVLGPLCILYHSNFSLGAANSNVALFCMLTVAGSGLIGRYIYARIHFGLYGRKVSLDELRDGAQSLHALSGAVSFLPELVARLERDEQKLLATQVPFLGFAKPIWVAMSSFAMRWRLHGYVRSALNAAARASPAIASQKKRLRRTATAYVDKRLTATRRVADFEAYERLFSLWHALHLPLIFMMVIAAVVHIVAVHVY